MKEINLTVQRTDSDFQIDVGLPDECGIDKSSVLVSFIYKQVLLTVWVPQDEPFVEYKPIYRQLIQIAKDESKQNIPE